MLKYVVALLFYSVAIAAPAPDEDLLGKSRNYPINHNRHTFPIADEFLVGTLSNMTKVYRHAVVKAGGDKMKPLELGELPPIRYQYRKTLTLEDYLARNRVTGIMIIKDDKVLLEQYRYGRTQTHQFSSMSIAKTITALLIAAALDDGSIASLDDPVSKYVPELGSGVYAKVTIRNALRMLSGVNFIRPTHDSLLHGRTWFDREGRPGPRALEFLESNKAEQGTEYLYSGADSFVLGLVLRGATKKSVAQYTSEKLWIPIGAEHDAAWLVDRSGAELTMMGFNASLRDYAKIGLLLANDGMLNGKQIISKEFLLDATEPDRQPVVNRPIANGKNIGYGYQLFIHPFSTRTFALYGHYGQSIFVQPETKTVIVMTQAWGSEETWGVEKRVQLENERFSFHIGVLRSLGAQATLSRVSQ